MDWSELGDVTWRGVDAGNEGGDSRTSLQGGDGTVPAAGTPARRGGTVESGARVE